MSKARATSARGIAIGVVLVALASACGGKVDDTPAQRTHATCYAMCTRIADAKCGADELNSCNADCKQMPSGNCALLLQSLLDCAWYDADYVCEDGGDRVVMYGCDAQWAKYLSCAGGQDGGT